MRNCLLFVTFSTLLNAATPAGPLWSELKQKREALPVAHQEFQHSRTFKLPSGDQASKRQMILDLAPGRWRERSSSGSGDFIRIFDGKDLYRLEEGESEYIRTKRRPKDDAPVPGPYAIDFDSSKATEVDRKNCGLAGSDHMCAILDVPIKRRQGETTMTQGAARISIELESGLFVSLRSIEAMERTNLHYQVETVYLLQKMTYGGTADAALFNPPSGDFHEVKKFSEWTATRIKKQLAGHPAPELALTDMQGKPLAISAFKGKTVLLDFWTTWCPPCRADAPALDKLYTRYSEKDLMIIGVSVSEDRAVVEKFLAEHPHTFPVALTTENDTLPRPYQVAAFPTYIVIGPDGTLTSAAEGDQGFSELRKMLKKAGLDVD